MPPTSAHPSHRIAAFVIDWFVLSGYAAAVFGVTCWIVGWERLQAESSYDPWKMQALAFLVMTLPFGLYLWVSEASRHQATLGKRAWGLRVQCLDGARPGRGVCALRTAAKLAPWEIAHLFVHQLIAHSREHPNTDPPHWLYVPFTLGTVGAMLYVLGLFGSGRTPYDRISGTAVRRTAV